MSEVDRWTAARVGLGRRGVSLPTDALLQFQADHAAARDAVHALFDVAGLRVDLLRAGVDCVEVTTATTDRGEYLRRPDLGRRLSMAGRDALEQQPELDVAVIVSDGLSATAANRHGAQLTIHLIRNLSQLRTTPVVLAPYARVGLLNEAGALLGARAAVMIVGERPGLSAVDGLSIYFEVAPRAGLTDADRNCIANIRPSGLPIPQAARQAAALVTAGLQQAVSGTGLTMDSAQSQRFLQT